MLIAQPLSLSGKAKETVLLLLVSLSIFGWVRAQTEPLITRSPEETLQQLGGRIIPKGTKLAHPVVTGDFASRKGNLVVLFHSDAYREFTGWVLVLEGTDYKKYILPEVRLPVSTEIEAVFFDNADHDPDKELLILCKHISGVGRYPGNITPFWTTYVYDWDGDRFVWLEEMSDKLDAVGKTNTVAGVRKLLRKQGY